MIEAFFLTLAFLALAVWARLERYRLRLAQEEVKDLREQLARAHALLDQGRAILIDLSQENSGLLDKLKEQAHAQ